MTALANSYKWSSMVVVSFVRETWQLCGAYTDPQERAPQQSRQLCLGPSTASAGDGCDALVALRFDVTRW